MLENSKNNKLTTWIAWNMEELCIALVGLTLFNKKNNRAYNISDGKKIKYGDYYEYVAKLLKIKPPERLSNDEYRARVNKNFLTFLTQSKFVDNSRLLNETNWRPNFDLENYLNNESA